MLFIKSPVSKLMVSHNLSTTAFRLLNMMLPNPICLICFQICSMGFISGVYGGICVITIFSGIFSLFDLCHTAPSHTKIKMSLQKYSDSSFKKTFMFSVLQFGKTKKKLSPVRGSTEPKAYLYSLIWWQATLGLILLLHQQYLGLLILPKPASSSNITLTLLSLCSDFISCTRSAIFFLISLFLYHLLFWDVYFLASLFWNRVFSVHNISDRFLCYVRLI